MSDPFADLPRGHYGAILADPPWTFRVWATSDKAHGSAAAHYNTMSAEELVALAPGCRLGRRGLRFIDVGLLASRRQGLVTSEDISAAGPWGWRGEADLQSIAGAPFGRGDRWPQPIIRRMDNGLPDRSHRLKALGNAIVPQIAEIIGRAIMRANQ